MLGDHGDRWVDVGWQRSRNMPDATRHRQHRTGVQSRSGKVLLGAILWCLVTGLGSTRAADSITIVSANVRYGTANDGENRWELRRDLLAATLRELQADLIGTQEMLPMQAKFLAEQLTEHDYFGLSRDLNNPDGEQTGVFVRRSRFVPQEIGHFWLSETPDIPGSKSWDSNLPRIATWLKLYDRAVGRRLLWINTHFDHRGVEARRQAALGLRSFLDARRGELPVLITGDFNCGEDSEPYRVLCAESSGLSDFYRLQNPERQDDEGTFNGFQGVRSGPRIDWILGSRDWTCDSAEIVRASRDGRYPSDHFFVRARVIWSTAEAPAAGSRPDGS